MIALMTVTVDIKCPSGNCVQIVSPVKGEKYEHMLKYVVSISIVIQVFQFFQGIKVFIQ